MYGIKRYFLVYLIFGSCATQHEDESTSPLERLLDGNKRYTTFHLTHPHQNSTRLNEISSEQFPFAVVVSCAYSRVPPEIIFDQGLGDLFVIRTAGNVIGDYELASIEYAIQKLNCKIVMIMGHENCGAIKTFIEQPLDSLPGHLNSLINFIRKQPNANRILNESTDKSYHAVINNIIYGLNLVKSDPSIIRERFDNNDLEIYGAIYHMKNGKVQIIADEIHK